MIWLGLVVGIITGVIIAALVVAAERDAQQQIDSGLTLCLMGQVAIGLMPNAEPTVATLAANPGQWTDEMERSAERARLALKVIGTMILQASTPEDAVVLRALLDQGQFTL